MKLKHYILFLLFFSLSLMAQESGTIPSMSIPKGSIPKTSIPNTGATPQYSISKPFEPTIFRTPSKVYDEPKPLSSQNKFSSKVSDLDPGLQFEKKLNSNNGKETTKVYRGNQFLGEFKTKTEKVRIVYRDHQYVDGDIIRIWVNDKVAVYEVYLQGEFQGIDLPLVKGFNKVEFEALNQGTSGPNTAEFHVYDEKGTLISANQWNLATGFKASVIMTKE
jgi:hypothetical protein